MSEPDYPYPKKPIEPSRGADNAPPPEPLGNPPSPPPLSNPNPQRLTCPTCGKVFTTREELTLHIETAHESPKKRV